MRRIRNVTVDEARALLRLCNRLREEPDALGRKKQLLGGLCDLIGATAALCTVLHRNRREGHEKVVSSVSFRTAQANGTLLSRDERPGSALLQSLQPLGETQIWGELRFYRHAASHARFTPRQQTLVDLVHAEMTWVYQWDVLLSSASVAALSPRTRETLENLLNGLSEKQIACKLRLSPNTVHHYVKNILRIENLRPFILSPAHGGQRPVQGSRVQATLKSVLSPS